MDSNFKERAVVFHLHLQGRIPRFAFDSGQIRQVLINIFKNALEAMPGGGALRIESDPGVGTTVTIALPLDSEIAVGSVDDPLTGESSESVVGE
jgi:signal transduction histidine kinase